MSDRRTASELGHRAIGEPVPAPLHHRQREPALRPEAQGAHSGDGPGTRQSGGDGRDAVGREDEPVHDGGVEAADQIRDPLDPIGPRQLRTLGGGAGRRPELRPLEPPRTPSPG